jgi:drug/metabolite transporter (DMT)-like permease
MPVVTALYAVVTKLPKHQAIGAIDMVFICMYYGLVLSLPFAIAELRTENWIANVEPSAWIAAVCSALAMTFFAVGFQALIKTIGPSYAALNQYINPLFVIVWAALLLHERPQGVALIGAGVALVGVWLVTNTINRNAAK